MLGKAVSVIQDFICIAVIYPEYGGPPSCLDTDARQTKVQCLFLFVDRLCIIIKQQQGTGFRIHHLDNQLQPFRFKVMPLINHQCTVLALGNMTLVYRPNDLIDQSINITGSLIPVSVCDNA